MVAIALAITAARAPMPWGEAIALGTLAWWGMHMAGASRSSGAILTNDGGFSAGSAQVEANAAAVRNIPMSGCVEFTNGKRSGVRLCATKELPWVYCFGFSLPVVGFRRSG